MNSIYQQAMGKDFYRLHPRIQERFGFDSTGGFASVGQGVMEEIWHGPFFIRPFLQLGAQRCLMFPETGRNVHFRVENYAYRDRYGRETVSWIRSFRFPQCTRRFDASMIYSKQRGCIVDYLGNRQHLAVDIHLSVASNGGLQLVSGAQRLYEGWLGCPFPLLLSGTAHVCEWFDEDTGKYRITVDVRNKIVGRLFGYRGSFDVSYPKVRPDVVPASVMPLREEVRE